MPGTEFKHKKEKYHVYHIYTGGEFEHSEECQAMKVLTIGGATRDVFIDHKVKTIQENHTSYIMLPEGRKVEISKIHYASGGGATNSAVSFARLGLEAESIFKIGIDPEGDFILAELCAQGVQTPHVLRIAQEQTGTSFILPSPSGDRAILVYRGANQLIRSSDIPESVFSNLDQIYITSLGGNASELLPQITKLAKLKNVRVASNPGTSQLTARVDTLEQSLPYIDILILNCYEANLLMKSLKNNAKPIADEIGTVPPLLHDPIRYYFHEIMSRGPQIAVVTNGADGVYVCYGKNIYYHPSSKIKMISSVGAGDAFGSTFVAYLAQQKSIEEAIRAGVINAASVLMHVGAKTGLLTADKIEEQRKNFDPSLLQVFELR